MFQVNDKVRSYTSQCIGCIIESVTYTGRIIKANKKSFKVEFDRFEKKYGSRVVKEGSCKSVETFRFWKTCSDGRNLFKNDLGAIITL